LGCAWVVFWIYWLVSAASSKESVRSGWRTRLTGVSAVGIFVIAGVLRGGSLAVHNMILAAFGAVLFACGIALAVWARLHLGRNWGMPMTQRAEPELVTSGPYRFVRHPIYSGLLAAMLGTALVNNLLGLIVVAVLIAYFFTAGSSRSGISRPPSPRRTRSTRAGRRCSSVSPVGQRARSCRAAVKLCGHRR
jgi:protein-S-isoprenylcysteine O-methyltransferase Ste14